MQSKYPVQIDYSMGTKKTDSSPFEQAWFVSQFGSHHLWLGPSWFAATMSRDIHSAHFIADGPLGPSALTLDNWMLLSQNG